MQVDPQAVATVSFTWTEDRKARSATVTLAAVGVELDEVVDLLVAGLEASADPVYEVEVGEIVERVTRVKKPQRERPSRPVPALPRPDEASVPTA